MIAPPRPRLSAFYRIQTLNHDNSEITIRLSKQKLVAAWLFGAATTAKGRWRRRRHAENA